ncbi:acetyl-CoA hydrolase/transferase family protein [Zopfochytrium polystomum]|nr:acetyl-CoA hydrolase/transferase family protein [Zopfochytrium polystomum]
MLKSPHPSLLARNAVAAAATTATATAWSSSRCCPRAVRHHPAARRGLLTRKGPPKHVSVEEAVSVIKSKQRVFRAAELEDVEFCHLHLEKPNPCSKPEHARSFFTNNFFVGANQRKNVALGVSSYVPTFLSEIPLLMRRGLVRPDVALINVSPPDRHGYVSLGVEVATALPAVETATTVIAQINPNMPFTTGYSFVHMNALDYICNVDEPLPERATNPPNDVESRIGSVIAGLISDGATLQMGIGAIPNAVLAGLKTHRNLGIHTEMFEEGVIPLVESGVVTNLNKTFLPGKTVTSFIMGTRRLYDFVDQNHSVAFMDASVTNNPRIIGSNPKVTAINSAIEVDLSGQVCADSVGTKMVSGVGGQVDFERGAALSQGGLPIICLPSTARDGSSKIVPTIKQGGGVITTRPHVHYVVTEWGYAFLFGKNLHQRAKALIEIAHPDHRADLEKKAFENLGIRAW